MKNSLSHMWIASIMTMLGLATSGVEASAIDSKVENLLKEASRAEAKTVSGVGPDVDTVLTGPTWCQGSKLGRYRFIVFAGGFEEVYHHLYVQLLVFDDDAHDVKIEKTVPVTEMQGLAMVLSDLRTRDPEPGLCGDAILEGNVVRRTGGDDRDESFELRVTSTGTYTVTFKERSKGTVGGK